MNENKAQPKEWYKGWRNIITILSFLTFFWPLTIVIMWPLATWSKKTKLIITGVFLGLYVVVWLVAFGGTYLSPITFGADMSRALDFMGLIASLWWWILFSTLIIASILSVIFKTQGKPIKKIWITALVVIGAVFLITMFFFLMGVSVLYQGMGTQ